jgi:hypothetical protein
MSVEQLLDRIEVNLSRLLALRDRMSMEDERRLAAPTEQMVVEMKRFDAGQAALKELVREIGERLDRLISAANDRNRRKE